VSVASQSGEREMRHFYLPLVFCITSATRLYIWE
jgi:hypothetical protein